MKFLSLAVTLLLLLGFSPVPPPSVESSLSTVSHFLEGDKEQRMACTGFQVGIIHIVTADHCLPKHGEDLFVDGKLTRIVKQHNGLALLEVEPGKPILLVAERNAPQGESVWAWGYAYGMELLKFHRYVAGYQNGHLITDSSFAGGMSGGPLIDSNGKVVGVIQAGNNIIGISCTVKELREFLK